MAKTTKQSFLGPNYFMPEKTIACSDAHRENPNYAKRTQSLAKYKHLTHEEMYRVNPRHKVTHETAVVHSLEGRLRMHFAENACTYALTKLIENDCELEEALKLKRAEVESKALSVQNRKSALSNIKQKKEMELAQQRKKEEEAKRLQDKAAETATKK